MSRRTGRPPGPGNSREAVLDAARRAFAAYGYAAASLRGIAADAGVDPAMVRHYFGSKAGLFQAAMRLPVDLSAVMPGVLAGDLDGAGERLVRFFLSIFESSADRSPFISLLRSAVSHEESARMFREFVTEQLLGPVAAALSSASGEGGGAGNQTRASNNGAATNETPASGRTTATEGRPADLTRLRATFVGSQMAGLVLLRYIVHVEPLASAPAETVISVIAPTVQRYLTGDLGLGS